MAPPLGVEPRPSALQADAQTSYARVGTGVSGDTPRPQLCSCQRTSVETSSSGPRSRTRMSRFRAARPAIGPVRINRQSAREAQLSRPSGTNRSRWGPRELNPAGLHGRRVYSAPRLPYRSRAPLIAMCRPKAERATESSRWLLRASAQTTVLREWSPPSRNGPTLLEGRALTERAGGEAAAIADGARVPEPDGPVRRFHVRVGLHDGVPGG